MSDEPMLLASRREAVVTLTLNRPDQRNALSRALRDSLVGALREVEADDEVAAVVLTGSGAAFCAGFDLKELSEGDAAEIFSDAQQYHSRLHTFAKPLIAAVNGPALAGGMDLASLCDVRLATTDARFAQPQVKLGVPAAYELTRGVLDEPTARWMCLTGDPLSAAAAVQRGYVAEVYADIDALREGAAQWASRVAAASGSGMMKQQFVRAQPKLFGD